MISGGLMIVGGTGLALSVLGLLLNAITLVVTLARPRPPKERRRFPYFLPAFLVMLTVSTALQVALVVISVRLWQGESASAWTLATWTAAAFLYTQCIAPLTRLCSRRLAMSIAAATGVANLGLMVHVLTAFPIWGTLLAMLLHWLACRS